MSCTCIVMRHLYCLLTLVLLLTANPLQAQQSAPDTQWHVTMQPIDIKAEREWANDTVAYRYNQMKYYVTTVLPYVKLVTDLNSELETKASREKMSRKQRKAYVSMREDELKSNYEPEVKKLNETQGVLMVKLIARQTGLNIYNMLSEYKNTVYATKWLAWSRLHGFNINKHYNPDDEIMLENIMEDLGYPLPGFYKEKLILTSN